ncbi:unnamed protein product, partial [Ixodes hexagonus]
VCNWSPNKFRSLRSCRRACMKRKTPLQRCYDKTLFSSCSSNDVKHSWWFHDAGACRGWNFPDGQCPQAGSAVFKTRSECLGNCSSSSTSDRPCSPPGSTTCGPKQLKHPYFAVTSGDGRLQCLRATVTQLGTHQCLLGANSFDSLSRCNTACGVHTDAG